MWKCEIVKKTYFTAGFFDFKNINALLDASATLAAWFGSLWLPALTGFDDVNISNLGVNGELNNGWTNFPPLDKPSNSFITEIEKKKTNIFFIKKSNHVARGCYL